MTATGITVLHRPATPDGFEDWLDGLRAHGVDGVVESVISAYADERLDCAVSVTFSTQAHLDTWLDGPRRAGVLRDGARRGFHRAATDLVVVSGELPQPGVAVFRHPVASGREADFATAQGDLTEVSSAFAGYEGTVVFPPGGSDEWTSMIRFRTERLLSGWLKSDERLASLPTLRSTLAREFSMTTSETTPFGTTVRIEDGRAELTPSWKSAMLVLLVLYPIVMLLSRFLSPELHAIGSPPWLATWFGLVVSVSALQWMLMPFAARRMRRWLDPVEGAGLAASLRGAAVIVVGYGLTFAVFDTVPWLQFWHYH
jgi:antibiotic biosynthesis monooxygenase (ABM) superfamily enzyme